LSIIGSGIAAGFSSFLVGIQILTDMSICQLCLISSVNFYIIFGTLFIYNLMPNIIAKIKFR
jgi:hypothetical protein